MLLKSVHLQNVGTYGNVKLDNLHEQPLVVISGINHDSDTADNRNGVGKSVLFGTLPNLAFEADPLALTKRNKKNFLGTKDSLIRWGWEHDGKEVVIGQDSKHYYVEIDGEDLEVHKSRQEVGREWIRKTFPISQDAFYSYAFVSGQRPHVFQRAKPSVRMEYLTEMFNLHVYDDLRKYFNAKLSEAKKTADRAKVLAGELQIAEAAMKGIAVRRAEVDAAAEIVEELRAQVSGSKSLREELNGMRSSIEKGHEGLQILDEIVALDLGDIDDPEEEIHQLIDMAEAINKHRAYLARLEEYEADSEELRTQLAKYEDVADCNVKALEKECAAAESAFNEAAADYDNGVSLADAHTELSDAIAELRESMPAKPKHDQEHYVELRAFAKAIVKVADEFEDADRNCKCPTCFQNVDVESLKKGARKARKDLSLAADAMRYFKMAAELEELEAELENMGDAPNMKELKKVARVREQEYEGLATKLKRAKRYVSIAERLSDMKAPKEVPKPATKMTLKQVQARSRALYELNTLRKQFAKLKLPDNRAEIDDMIVQATKASKRLSRELNELQQQYETAHDAHAKLKLEFVRKRDHFNNVKRLRAELEGMQDIIDQMSRYEHMTKAFSAQALKSEAVLSVLHDIETQLNALQALTFAEPMTFSLTVKNGGIEAQVTRKSGATSDVANMSGAESDCFALLWAITMLVFVEPSKRPSFIILDEPDRGCSPGVRAHLVHNFLPKLMSIVDNVFWITPQDTDIFGDVPHWIIEKRGGESTVTMQ